MLVCVAAERGLERLVEKGQVDLPEVASARRRGGLWAPRCPAPAAQSPGRSGWPRVLPTITPTRADGGPAPAPSAPAAAWVSTDFGHRHLLLNRAAAEAHTHVRDRGHGLFDITRP